MKKQDLLRIIDNELLEELFGFCYTRTKDSVNAGMVICVADDPGMHSSQNEQDSRHHAIAAKSQFLL